MRKDPQNSTPPDYRHDVDTDIPLFSVDPITLAEIVKCVRSFPRASETGGSGLTAAHLRDMLDVPAFDTSFCLRESLFRLSTLFIQGKICPTLSPWIAAAPLTAATKRKGGIHPIVVGEVLRRMISSTMMSRVADDASSYLETIQIGVSICGGCESIVHSSHRLTSLLESEPSFGLLQIDFRKAFNNSTSSTVEHP